MTEPTAGRRHIYNITSVTQRRTWASVASFTALAASREAVIVTGVPTVERWPALTAWADVCARAPRLGRVFSGASRVFYHELRDSKKKPLAAHEAARRLPLNMSCAEFVRATHADAPDRFLYLASPLPGVGNDDLHALVADIPGAEQLAITEASERPLSVNIWAGRGVVAEAHYDGSHNTFVQVRGKKRFVLMPASASSQLRLFPEPHPRDRHTQWELDVDGTAAVAEGDEVGGADSSGEGREVVGSRSCNASPLIDAQEAVLSPGEVLHVPAYTFHRVSADGGETETSDGELSWSVNVFSESLENAAAGQMVAAGLPSSLQPAAGTPPALYTRLLVFWLRRIILLVLRGKRPSLTGPEAESDAARAAAAFLSPLVESRFRGLHTTLGCDNWVEESCPRVGALPEHLREEASNHAALVAAPLLEAEVQRVLLLRPAVVDLILVAFVEVTTRHMVGMPRLCLFLRCLALPTPWAEGMDGSLPIDNPV
jgi:hypothetical protein